MDTVYISQENCSVRREGLHLLLTAGGEMITTVPLVGVKTIVLLDSVNLTAPALDLLLSNGIDVVYISKWGKLKGRIMSAKGGGSILRLAQHSAFLNTTRRIEIAKAIVSAKICNQMLVAKKYQYNNTLHDYDDYIRMAKEFEEKLERANCNAEIMGIEGLAAKHYWNSFRGFLKNPVFTHREYRPSPDYVNALLNLGYAFLANEITTCLTVKHFDLEIGFLHSIHYGRNSLSLDIMEEFRASFIDYWVLSLFNKNQFKEEHFNIIGGDFRLTQKGFYKFCTLYHGRIVPWREKFRIQANRLKNALLEGKPYEPYRE